MGAIQLCKGGYPLSGKTRDRSANLLALLCALPHTRAAIKLHHNRNGRRMRQGFSFKIAL
jgi:hypothetical protein